MQSKKLEFKRIIPEMDASLAFFFKQIIAEGDDKIFHPHAFDDETASKIAGSMGMDQYLVVMLDDKIVGYGMLRGWDEGYEIPSLGMIIHKSMRGHGIGMAFIIYLHSVAIVCGAKAVRLSVYESNDKAIRLYKKVGYSFSSQGDGKLIGKWTS